MTHNFLIIVTGYNCEKYVQKCYESLLAQTYGNWEAIFIDDGSTDGTFNDVTKIVDGTELVRFAENKGAAQRRFGFIDSRAKKDDIIVLLGMDDQLLPDALETIAKQYDDGKWMTYGNWIDQHGKGLPETFELDFPDAIHETRDYRKVKYRSTAPNTFYKFLFDKIPADDFKVDGQWIKATTESPLMFACLEMCGKERIGVIKKPIYLYNIGRPDNARRRFGSEYQDHIYQTVISRPKKDLVLKSPLDV